MRADRRGQMYEGPWLDRLFPISLLDGRMVSVTGFSVLPTNFGILEGGLDRESNATQRERIVALAKERYGEPLVAVEPTIVPMPEHSTPRRPRERLPWMACIAHLTSEPLHPENTASTVTLVWWQDRFERPLPEEIAAVAEGLAWAQLAKDYDFW